MNPTTGTSCACESVRRTGITALRDKVRRVTPVHAHTYTRFRPTSPDSPSRFPSLALTGREPANGRSHSRFRLPPTQCQGTTTLPVHVPVSLCPRPSPRSGRNRSGPSVRDVLYPSRTVSGTGRPTPPPPFSRPSRPTVMGEEERPGGWERDRPERGDESPARTDVERTEVQGRRKRIETRFRKRDLETKGG